MLENKVAYLCLKLPANYTPCLMHIAICRYVRCLPIRLLLGVTSSYAHKIVMKRPLQHAGG